MRSGGNDFNYCLENKLTKLANFVQFKRMFMFCLEDWGVGPHGPPLATPLLCLVSLRIQWKPVFKIIAWQQWQQPTQYGVGVIAKFAEWAYLFGLEHFPLDISPVAYLGFGKKGGHGERAKREPITGVWWRSPQRGPGAEPLVGGLKMKHFLILNVQWKPQIRPFF